MRSSSHKRANITGYAVYAKYLNGSNLGFDFDTGGNANSIATSQYSPGYGAASTTISLGPTDAPGTTVLAGANTYTGPTTVYQGTLQAGVASVPGVSGAFGNNSAVIMGSTASATLNITGYNTQIGSLTGGGASGGNVVLGSATLTVGGDNTSPAPYAGNITGDSGSLTKIGTGTLSLAGNCDFTGGITVNGGTLNLVGDRGFNAGIFPSGNAYTINAGGAVMLTGDWTTNGNADSFIINGGTLSTVNTYADIDGARQYINNVTMTGGLIAGQGIRLGNNGGTPTYTINAAPGGSTISSPVVLVNTNVTGPVDFYVNGGPAGSGLLISGAIRDFSTLPGLPLFKDGPGTMTLTGANTYVGTTTINEGTLQLGNGGATGSLSPSSAIVDNDTLAFTRSNTMVQGIDFSSSGISGTRRLGAVGTGHRDLTANNTYSGSTSVSAGALLLSGGTLNPAGTVNVAGGAAFGGAGQAGSTTCRGGWNHSGRLQRRRQPEPGRAGLQRQRDDQHRRAEQFVYVKFGGLRR